HQPGIKTRLTARENLHFFHPGDGARLPEALAQAGLAGFEDVPGVALTAGLRRGGVLLGILVLPLSVPVLIFAAAAMDAASMHL
ncbi:heme exporter protein CcmB, partial [Salmonella enterica subsp. enterica serovar Typhimurium]